MARKIAEGAFLHHGGALMKFPLHPLQPDQSSQSPEPTQPCIVPPAPPDRKPRSSRTAARKNERGTGSYAADSPDPWRFLLRMSSLESFRMRHFFWLTP